MKNLTIFLAVGFFVSSSAIAQLGINPENDPPALSAGLDIKFTDKGFLQPRLTTDQITSISDPAIGLMVYNISTNKPVYFDGVTWRNYDGTKMWFSCGNPLEVKHMEGLAAPVSKTLSYGTVSGIPGEPGKCWITRNLGADQQATAYNDATEASAGWYWQFNRLQGYKHDGTTRTPATEWITSIIENSNWIMANDPCANELGADWRLPTETEWVNVDAAGLWTTYTGPWGSILKMHEAGRLTPAIGALDGRGTYGRYWSSTQDDMTKAWALLFSTNSILNNDAKTQSYSVRCIKCNSPSSPGSPAEGVNVSSQNGIIWEWAPVTDVSGYKWNTSNDFYSARDLDTCTSMAENGLTYGTEYTRYVWAYDDCGHSSVGKLTGSTLPFAFTCETDSVTISHVAGDVAPVGKTVKYATVTGVPGETSKCWITSNLGASQQATSINDVTEASRGWYWQFNLRQGYKYEGTTRTPNTSWISSIDQENGWLSENDPCVIELGNNWRIPTETEWKNIDAAGGWTTMNGPWSSVLKLHAAGRLNYNNGALDYEGTDGRYWSNSYGISTKGWLFRFSSSSSYVDSAYGKTYGCSIRCIRCPSDSPPVSPTAGAHFSQYNQITWKWDPVSGATGYKWNTTFNYNSAIDLGNSTLKTETSLNTGSYSCYVWAYNDCGHSTPVRLDFETLPFKCGYTKLCIDHVADTIAPVDKSVEYATATNIPGETSKCWITSNLGADHQATAKDDATEASAGWYWQFNRKQGYKHTGTARTPNTAWIWPITEWSAWISANDPCTIEIGSEWRIPTSTEWNNVISANGWIDWNGPWDSALKLHAAGILIDYNGNLDHRGDRVLIWTSTEYTDVTAYYFYFTSGGFAMIYNSKAYAIPLRCLKN